MSAMKNTNNMALEAFSKAGDLHKRILFTLVALFLYRFGSAPFCRRSSPTFPMRSVF